jgi:hypothetical protein
MKTLPGWKMGIGCLGLALSLATQVGRAQVPFPQPGTGVPISTPVKLIANGGDVKVTFQANTASYDDYLFLFSPLRLQISTKTTSPSPWII